MQKSVSPSVLLIAMLAIALLAASPGAAEVAEDEAARGWMLRVSPTWMESDRDGGSVVGYDGGTVSGFAPRDIGITVAGEYRYSPRVGLEVGVVATSSGVGVRARDGVVVATGTSSYGSFTLGPDFHLTPQSAADVYFGPFLAYSARTDVGFNHGEWAGVRIGGGFGWGAVLGADFAVGERGWQVCASVRYLDANLDGTDGNGDPFDVDLGPTAVGVGVGYRF